MVSVLCPSRSPGGLGLRALAPRDWPRAVDTAVTRHFHSAESAATWRLRVHLSTLVVAGLWLLLSPPNPSHMRCASPIGKLEGTDVDVVEHIASGTFRNWQIWKPFPSKEACTQGMQNLKSALSTMPQRFGSETYVCLRDVTAQAVCLSSEDARLPHSPSPRLK